MNYEFFLEITKKTSANYIKEVIVIADEELSYDIRIFLYKTQPVSVWLVMSSQLRYISIIATERHEPVPSGEPANAGSACPFVSFLNVV